MAKQVNSIDELTDPSTLGNVGFTVDEWSSMLRDWGSFGVSLGDVTTTDNGDGTYTHTIETPYALHVEEDGPNLTRWQRFWAAVARMVRWR